MRRTWFMWQCQDWKMSALKWKCLFSWGAWELNLFHICTNHLPPHHTRLDPLSRSLSLLLFKMYFFLFYINSSKFSFFSCFSFIFYEPRYASEPKYFHFMSKARENFPWAFLWLWEIERISFMFYKKRARRIPCCYYY